MLKAIHCCLLRWQMGRRVIQSPISVSVGASQITWHSRVLHDWCPWRRSSNIGNGTDFNLYHSQVFDKHLGIHDVILLDCIETKDPAMSISVSGQINDE